MYMYRSLGALCVLYTVNSSRSLSYFTGRTTYIENPSSS